MKRFLLALALATIVPAYAQSATSQHFAGLTLTDQDGQRVALSDLMKGRTVVVSSFFSHCASSCPVMAHSLTELQSRFANRLGRDLWFVSISVDPENDTPAVLKNYARRNMAKKGWSFLTGSREEVDAALKRPCTFDPGRHDNTTPS